MREWLFTDKHALRGTAMCRILSGLAVFGLLATNFSSRIAWVGADWAASSREHGRFPLLWILTSHSDTCVTVFYLLTMAASAAVVFGWHSRLTGLLALTGFVTIVEQNPLVGDQGDNILRIGMTWLLLMHTNGAWAVGRWRPVMPLWLGNALHNIALCALSCQVLLVYVSAALFKLRGSLWRDGTALFYPLQLPEFRPFPGLSDLLVGNSVILAIATWSAMVIQLGFPLMVLHRLTCRIGLILVVLLHLGIALLMGLPWFSLSMVAFDALFVGSATYASLDGRLRRWRSSFARPRSRRSPEPSGPRPQR